MPIATTIKLPCTARALEEAIRSFCEPHGIYDTAVVRGIMMKDKDSWGPSVVLKICAEDSKK